MARKKRREPSPGSPLQQTWEKYGTWITAVVAAVLVVVLAVTLMRRHAERRLAKGRAELTSIARDDVNAVMRLKRLELEYDDTELADGIQLKLAQALQHDKRYDEAEKGFRKLIDREDVLPVYRVQARLGWAYAALAKKEYAEARKRFQQVKEDKLYAFEARRMLELIDELDKKETPTEGDNETGG